MVLLIELAILGLIAIESSYHALKVARLARQRFPDQSTRGLTYAVIRSPRSRCDQRSRGQARRS